MTDYSELKRLAVATEDCEDEQAWKAYLSAASPSAVLELIAENERWRESHEQICTNYNRVSFASEERGKQIDQLKVENEALCAAVSGKVICDLELFEGLRDAAAEEAAQHAQGMGIYRPHRQKALDDVVRQCNELIDAAMAKEDGQ